MKTLRLNSTDSIRVSDSTITLTGLWYCHSYKLDSICVNYDFVGTTYYLTINNIPYYKPLGRALVKQAYDFITSAMKAIHENPSLR